MKNEFLVILLIFVTGCSPGTSQDQYLREISNNLDQVKSASYYSVEITSAPGDTAKLGESRELYYRIFINPSDTLVGSSSASFSPDDTTKMIRFYDGSVRGEVNWDKQFVKTDSFKNNPHPFRLVHYPFYTKINEIIKYTLTTTDSIQTSFRDYGDSLFFSLRVIDKHIYFNIRPIVIKNEYIPENEVSQFDVWFDKKELMPYRMRSKWHHITFLESCHGAKFNLTRDTTFIAGNYFPSHFEIKYNDPYAPKAEQKEEMAGKSAPGWELKDADQKNVKLGDLNSKVLLIQFTGIGCGPCHQAIPFLKNLVDEYKTKDFEFVSIESWSKNMETLKRYQERNEFNFKFLKSTDEVIKSYGVSLVPVFFVIDENRVIREVIKGYNKEATDKVLKESIDKYL